MSFIPLIVLAVTGLVVLRMGLRAFDDIGNAESLYKEYPLYKTDPQRANSTLFLAAYLLLHAIATFIAASFAGSIGAGIAVVLSQFIR